jgi:RNA polymerase subunit RPABC4/transcription elongation factor Spt4
MQCGKCGAVLDVGMKFCPECGTPLVKSNTNMSNLALFQITENEKRQYSIIVNRNEILFNGEFWYLKDKEFVSNKNKSDKALIKNFMGMGYLAKRSPRKCILFVIVGSMLELVKAIIDKLSDWVDEANNYLQWIDKSISLPDWMNYTMNTLAIICILLAIVYFFSKKKVIEISFTDKRICVPQNSMTSNEYHTLYQSIINAKNMK